MLNLLRRDPAKDLSGEDKKVLEMKWEHNFGPLGLTPGPQHPLKLTIQLEKQGPIFRHIRDAMLRCPRDARGLETTVTDGFFGLYAAMRGKGHMDIVDVGAHLPEHKSWHMQQTQVAAKLLGLDRRCSVSAKDIFSIEGTYDFGISAGVLNNFPDPAAVLKKYRELISGPLVLQAQTAFWGKDDWFFESPSSVQPWGCALSRKQLIYFAVEAGWTVVSESSVRYIHAVNHYRILYSTLCV